jgi:hypothetical protein
MIYSIPQRLKSNMILARRKITARSNLDCRHSHLQQKGGRTDLLDPARPPLPHPRKKRGAPPACRQAADWIRFSARRFSGEAAMAIYAARPGSSLCCTRLIGEHQRDSGQTCKRLPRPNALHHAITGEAARMVDEAIAGLGIVEPMPEPVRIENCRASFEALIR